jgi:hypothetical protein
VALLPQTQWLMVASLILANMLTQKGAEDSEQAMALASLKQDASLRQEDTDSELTQRVMMAWEEVPEQPNQESEEEKMQDEAEVQDTGNSVGGSWLALFLCVRKYCGWDVM